MDPRTRTVVITLAPVKPGHLPDVANLFAETNPPLVADQPAWLGASFTADAEAHTATVLAYWTDADAYRAFSKSAAFAQTMRQFAPHLSGPPVVSLSHVLVGMTQDTVWRHGD